MIPKHDHPLTLAYINAATSRTHEAMVAAMLLARSLEKDASPQLLAQCKLAAEVVVERQMRP